MGTSMTDETVFDGYVTLSKETGSTDGYINALQERIRTLEAYAKHERSLGAEPWMMECNDLKHRIEHLEAALREVSGTSKYVVASEIRNLALRALSEGTEETSVEGK